MLQQSDNVFSLFTKCVVAQMLLSLNLHKFNTLISEFPIMSFNFSVVKAINNDDIFPKYVLTICKLLW